MVATAPVTAPNTAGIHRILGAWVPDNRASEVRTVYNPDGDKVTLEIGQVVDKYVVERKLGEGATATVYRVRHQTLNSAHALKVLDATGAALRERLMKEGQVQARLRHPNVVSVTDVISVGGSPGLVMEYVKGPSLHEWLQDNEPTLEQALRTYAGIVAGVRAAHDIGVIHRDLKPQNVMLDSTTTTLRPKVADFGLVKHLDTRATSSTQTGTTMGTPEYMAPEQIRDAASVDHRADMWSLGCILYRLVCGHGPFDGPDPLTVFNKVASTDYPPPRTRVPDLPPVIEQVIGSLLKVRPADRVQSCDELLELLGLDLEPTSADASGWNWTPAEVDDASVPAMVLAFPESRDNSWSADSRFEGDASATPIIAMRRRGGQPPRVLVAMSVMAIMALATGVVIAGLFLGNA